jgi:hypothetical protein
MENVGYVLMDRSRVLDGDGNEEEILSLSIRGMRFGVRASEMKELLRGGALARVERLRRNWRSYLDGVEGTVELSRSGKAVNLELFNSRSHEPGSGNIELFDTDRYTISLRALRSVLSGESRYAMVAEVPGARSRPAPRKGPATYQARFGIPATS